MVINSDPFKDRRRWRNRGKTIQESSAAAVADSDFIYLAVSLPEEIISDILIKLPVKSLSRFKSVCKSWRILISDPAFVKAHLKGNMQNKDHASHKLIMKTALLHFDVKFCSMSSVMNGESSITGLNYPWVNPHRSVRIIGSVNGLVCLVCQSLLSGEASLYVWNPCTGKAKRLPSYGTETDVGRIVSYGFGYDEVNDDYKLVVIYLLRTSSSIEWNFRPEGKIYGLKSGSWSRIENVYKRTRVYALCTYVSGSLNWEAADGLIASFDLSKETWSVISRPVYLNEERAIWGLNIGNLDGKLCQLFYLEEMMKIDLWVMKEFGKVESWLKMYSIPYQCEIDAFKYCAFLIIFSKNKVLMLIGSDLMLYNLETKTVTQPDIQNISNFLDVATYVESLVSPDDASNKSISELADEDINYAVRLR
ncbi:F-box/kelch-repeat protein At3g23880-like [Impatiens glandulifera]|uniref:F-box/kelch-repeat protein At3g23880-like n=1 Tax=Impatiens glandulifera TaxID=253017 RepID=UPI001FB12C2A|nr:F-box/kelch-repeat protein At3g23880-like [Impatiens glandulifera]